VTTIYFDAHSLVGHPSPDKWLPLEYKEGRKTDQIHNCPKKQQALLSSNGNGNPTPAVAAKETPKLDLNNLNVIRVIAAALEEYIRMKEAGK
jgi:hypothetical protein